MSNSIVSQIFTDIVEWSPQLETGFRAIDRDHKEIIHLLGNLRSSYKNGVNKDLLSDEINCLIDLMVEHFKREEAFMSHGGYPKLEEHRQEHNQITNLLNEIRHLFENEPDRIEFFKVIDYLGARLSEHILKSDWDYIPYLRGTVSDENKNMDIGDLGLKIDPKKQLTLTLSNSDAEIILLVAEGLETNLKLADEISEFLKKKKIEQIKRYRNQAKKMFTS